MDGREARETGEQVGGRPRVRTERVEIETERRENQKKKTSGLGGRPTKAEPDEADTHDDQAPPAAPEALTRLNGLYHPADRSTFYTSTASSAPIRRPVGYCTRRILLSSQIVDGVHPLAAIGCAWTLVDAAIGTLSSAANRAATSEKG